MTTMYMLDTDSCIYLINNHPKMQPLAALDDCMISVIVRGELLFGCEQSVSATATRNFANQIALAELTTDVAEHYGEIRATLKKKGQLIGPNDLWIAAHARCFEVTLVTNNTKVFKRVSGLSIANWLQE
ncbi:PIN domain-containing protein [Beggiatoa alba]|nr:PIN domain-containing protein [Beggiatoa alba]